MERFEKQMEFIYEIDKIKHIFRHTKLFDDSRYENDAEHSWHVCIMAVVLEEYANEPVDIKKVLKMLLIHDVVEIYSGDYIVYTDKEEEKSKKEQEGAEKVFAFLPEDQREEMYSLWQEFELRESSEAKYARAIDRYEPILQNLYTKAHSWVKHNISSERVLEKNKIVKDGSEKIWKHIKNIVNKFIDEGLID